MKEILLQERQSRTGPQARRGQSGLCISASYKVSMTRHFSPWPLPDSCRRSKFALLVHCVAAS